MSHSGLTLRSAVLPMFLLYLVSYALISQGVVQEPSKLLFVLKLVLGASVLGGASYFYIRGIPSIRIGIPVSEIRWRLAALCILTGVFLLYLSLFLRYLLQIPIDIQRGFLYYAPFSFLDPSVYILALLMVFYVVVEEMYFRGLLYRYLSQYLDAALAVGAAVILFIVAHLNVLAPRFVMMLVLSLIAIWLLEATGTLFYGILVHASLNLASMLLLTDDVWRYMPPVVPTFFVLFAGTSIGLSLLLKPSLHNLKAFLTRRSPR